MDVVKQILTEIINGKKKFTPASDSQSDLETFQSVAKVLIYADQQGWLDSFLPHPLNRNGKSYYDLILVQNGLSYEGELYLQNMSQDNNSNTGEAKYGSPKQYNFHQNVQISNKNDLGQREPLEQFREVKVFICHSSEDKEIVRELYRNLKNDGFIPWLDDEDISPGMEWEIEIKKAIHTSNIILVCLSNNSISKIGYVQKEIKFALDRADEFPEGNIYIIPVKFEKCKVPERLKKWQYVNVYEKDGYAKLKSSLEMYRKN